MNPIEVFKVLAGADIHLAIFVGIMLTCPLFLPFCGKYKKYVCYPIFIYGFFAITHEVNIFKGFKDMGTAIIRHESNFNTRRTQSVKKDVNSLVLSRLAWLDEGWTGARYPNEYYLGDAAGIKWDFICSGAIYTANIVHSIKNIKNHIKNPNRRVWFVDHDEDISVDVDMPFDIYVDYYRKDYRGNSSGHEPMGLEHSSHCVRADNAHLYKIFSNDYQEFAYVVAESPRKKPVPVLDDGIRWEYVRECNQ